MLGQCEVMFRNLSRDLYCFSYLILTKVEGCCQPATVAYTASSIQGETGLQENQLKALPGLTSAAAGPRPPTRSTTQHSFLRQDQTFIKREYSQTGRNTTFPTTGNNVKCFLPATISSPF